MVNYPSNWRIRLFSLALAIAVTCPAHAFVSVGGRGQQQSSSLLRYRASDESSSYTDTLWRAALHPAHDMWQASVSPNFSETSSTMTLHPRNESNAFPLELRPISIESPDIETHDSSSSRNGLIETAKAFVPVAIEFGVVAAVAGNAQTLFNGW